MKQPRESKQSCRCWWLGTVLMETGARRRLRHYLRYEQDDDVRLSASLGVAGRAFASSAEPEESLTPSTLRGGLAPPEASAVGQERGSLLPNASRMLLRIGAHFGRLGGRSDFEPRLARRRDSLHHFLTHCVQLLGAERRSDWMQRLASPEVPLGMLAQCVPKQVLSSRNTQLHPVLPLLLQAKPPLDRASWFVQVCLVHSKMQESRDASSGAAWLAATRGPPSAAKSAATRRLAQQLSRDWTGHLLDFLTTHMRRPAQPAWRERQRRASTASPGRHSPARSRGRADSSAAPPAAPPAGRVDLAAQCVSRHDDWLYVAELALWQLRQGMVDEQQLVAGLVELLREMRCVPCRAAPCRAAPCR